MKSNCDEMFIMIIHILNIYKLSILVFSNVLHILPFVVSRPLCQIDRKNIKDKKCRILIPEATVVKKDEKIRKTNKIKLKIL